MRSALSLLFVSISFSQAQTTTCAFTEPPVITRVVDAASGNIQVSSNTLLTIFGRNFTPVGVTVSAGDGFIRDNKFPTELNCVAVQIGDQRAPILYVQNNQINFQAPTIPMTGDLPIKVIMNPDRPNAVSSTVETIRIQSFSPAFFTFNGRSVAARAPNGGPIIADPSVVPDARPARPGEIIELYATGLGPAQTPVASGTIAPMQVIPTTNRVRVSIGGTTLSDADILYAGLAPGNISGLYQINVRVPATAANGDLLIAMSINSEQSVAGTTIPVRAP
jgi:uncharacterized protein (TIGR03437 family)